MDRKEVETEKESTKQSPPLMPSFPTPNPIETSTNMSLTTTDDDTSNDAFDTFESWTLVNDKKKPRINITLEYGCTEEDFLSGKYLLRQKKDCLLIHHDTDEKTEDEEADIKAKHEPQSPDSSSDFTNEELSDGISVISESESVGRISPNPYIRENLHNLNMKFALGDHMDDAILNKMREDMAKEAVPLMLQRKTDTTTGQQLRQRRKYSLDEVAARKALQKASQTPPPRESKSHFILFLISLFTLICLISGALYVWILIGGMEYLKWSPPTGMKKVYSIEELSEKYNRMEMQNHLMRSALDSLLHQFKYLIPPNEQKAGKHKEYRESKIFKAWTGNGDSLKAVDITKEDLKTPYKCPDGSFVEIANMCVEQRPANEPSIVDQFEQVVDDMKKHSDVVKTFEQVAEELQGIQDNPFEQAKDAASEPKRSENFEKNFAQYKQLYEYEQFLLRKRERARSKKEFEKYFDKNGMSKRIDPALLDALEESNEGNEWKAEEFINDSKEKKYHKENSKEHHGTKDFHDSKENSKENQYNERNKKQKHKHDKKIGHDHDDSGEWQEKLMKHREEQRKQNEQKYQSNKNWYMKRADSRENKRSGEKQYR